MTIQTTDFKASKKLTNFARKHVEKLEAISDRIVESRILLKLDAAVDNNNKVCEMSVQMPGKVLFVSKQTDSFEESVVKAVEAIRHQLEHWKSTMAGRSV